MSVAWRFTLLTRLASCSTGAIAIFPSCTTEHRAPSLVVTTAWPSPANDASPSCADVGDQRVCWHAPPDGNTTVAGPRPTPPVALSPLGWRCSGVGAARFCVDRSRDAVPFACAGSRCVQRQISLPDDGEWECADFAGAVVCRGSARAAGVPPGADSPNFTCGPRHGALASPGERICVDLSPDFPNGVARGVRCHFEPDNGLVRICELDPAAHGLTDPCDRMHPCVSGLQCIAARCLPFEPAPSCWVDADCDKGSCRFGTCTEGVP